MNRKFFKLLISIWFLSTAAMAQNESFVGLSSNFEVNNYTLSYKYGLTFEKQFAPKWSFETGLFSKDYIFSTQNVKMKFASIPFFLKFNSNILNLSAGVNSSYYLGWKYISNLVQPASVNYNVFSLAASFKISKDIKLNERLFLEPEFTLNLYNPYGNNVEIGSGLKLKYKLSQIVH